MAQQHTYHPSTRRREGSVALQVPASRLRPNVSVLNISIGRHRNIAIKLQDLLLIKTEPSKQIPFFMDDNVCLILEAQ